MAKGLIPRRLLREKTRRLTVEYSSRYTLNMNTAISLPDTLYEKAERAALYMGIPQSKLLSIALEEFLEKYNGQMITKKINEVYEKIDQTEFDRFLDVGLEATRNLTKNDTW